MTSNNLTFFIHNHNLAPSYSVPCVDSYQSQKNIQVVSNADPLCFGNEKSSQSTCQILAQSNAAFFALRLEMALGQATAGQPSYFPGATIPGPGGPSCSEVERGNLLFDQFVYLLKYDSEMFERISGYEPGQNKSRPNPSRLFCRQEENSEAWLWQYTPQPQLYFLHQAPLPDSGDCNNKINIHVDQLPAIANLRRSARALLERTLDGQCQDDTLIQLLTLISDAWFSPSSGLAPITWGANALAQAIASLSRYRADINDDNILPFLFELEAMATQISLGDSRESFARGVFAGNFIDVAMAPITSIKATEFCVRERLFDEVINLTSRGFAPVVLNEYGLVADGNHRVTAAYVWNILKYCQDLEWSLDNDDLQKRVANFADAVQSGLLKSAEAISPVSLHQALSHLAYFLCRPDWRARLNSYTKPLLKRHDFIHQLPVVVLPEYLSGAVVKSHYDDGNKIERACPSMYEAMSLNNHLVLPPRASYHFTDAALLPWFTVLRKSCGSKHRTSAFGSRSRAIPRK